MSQKQGGGIADRPPATMPAAPKGGSFAWTPLEVERCSSDGRCDYMFLVAKAAGQNNVCTEGDFLARSCTECFVTSVQVHPMCPDVLVHLSMLLSTRTYDGTTVVRRDTFETMLGSRGSQSGPHRSTSALISERTKTTSLLGPA